MEKKDFEQTVVIKQCPTCGLELAGTNAICVCDTSVIPSLTKDNMIGSTLAGYYKIQEVIGRGGMGIVYKAKDMFMDRVIAIKMLHAHLVADPQSLQRFQQEAKAASSIGHQNVITAYDFGYIPDTKQPFLVMELLVGKSLADVIEEENGVDYERAMKIFIQACDALAAAHAKGVLHRDLKPSNIMLVQTKEDPDFVKIVDFGIAKLLPHSGKEMSNLTQTGEVFGSPLYMSPEQFLGGKLDERTDVYAMGCVMYEALIGRPPIMGEHVLETMYKHINEAPQKFALARPDKKISDKIESVVMRALEKDQDQRYQTMAELRDALQLTQKGFKDRRPLKVRLAAWRSKIKRAQKRHADFATTVLFGVVLACAAVLICWCLTITARSTQDQEWKAMKVEGQKAYAREDLPTAERKFMDAAKKALDNFGEEDPRYTDTLKRLAWVFESRGNYTGARKIYEKINKLNPEDISKVKLAQLAYAGKTLAETLMEDDFTEGFTVALKKAVITLDKYFGPTDPGLVPLLEQLGTLYKRDGKWAEAENEYMRIISIMTETEGQKSVGTARAFGQIAELYKIWGNDKAAEENFQQAKEIYSEVLGPEAAAPIIAALKDNLDHPERLIKPKVKPDITIPVFGQ